jgi:hypothetical protein
VKHDARRSVVRSLVRQQPQRLRSELHADYATSALRLSPPPERRQENNINDDGSQVIAQPHIGAAGTRSSTPNKPRRSRSNVRRSTHHSPGLPINSSPEEFAAVTPTGKQCESHDYNGRRSKQQAKRTSQPHSRTPSRYESNSTVTSSAEPMNTPTRRRGSSTDSMNAVYAHQSHDGIASSESNGASTTRGQLVEHLFIATSQTTANNVEWTWPLESEKPLPDKILEFCFPDRDAMLEHMRRSRRSRRQRRARGSGRGQGEEGCEQAAASARNRTFVFTLSGHGAGEHLSESEQHSALDGCLFVMCMILDDKEEEEEV